MHSPVEQIKERLSIEEVVSSYIKLEKAGVNLKARCPFHNEKTPSFFVSPQRNTYYCFGCGASGDIFTFVQEFEGLDFKGALRLLALRAGISLEAFNKKAEDEKDSLYAVMEASVKYFESNLQKEPQVKSYLLQRGLNQKTIKDFRIGYAKPLWKDLFAFLENQKFSLTIIEKAGLIKKSEKNNSSLNSNYYDRFRSRIMFPIFDSGGRPVAFSGRFFETEKDNQSNKIEPAKYLNSPDTPIFNKSTILYGLDKAKDSIRKNNFSILVEGQIDLLLAHQAGFKNTIASSGTALSEVTISKENVVSNLGLVRRLSRNMVLAFDSDKAGYKASERAGKIGLSLGMDIKVASLPNQMDPADVISKLGKDAWRLAVKNSKHIIDFMLDKILFETKEDLRNGLRIAKEKVLPYVASLDSASEQSFFISKIANYFGVQTESILTDLKNLDEELIFSNTLSENIIVQNNEIVRKEQIEKKIVGVYFWQEKNNSTKEFLENLSREFKKIIGFDFNQLALKYQEKLDECVFEAEVYYADNFSLTKEWSELLLNLKEESLREQLSEKMRLLNKINNSNNVEATNQLLADYQIISNQLEEVKKNRYQYN